MSTDASTRNRSCSASPCGVESTHRGGHRQTGMVVHSVTTTPANVHDVTEAHRLLHGGEIRSVGSIHQHGVAKRAENRELGVEWQVAMKARPAAATGAGKRRRRWRRSAKHRSGRRWSIPSCMYPAGTLATRRSATGVCPRTRNGWRCCWAWPT